MKARLRGPVLAALLVAAMTPGLQAENAAPISAEAVQELIRQAEAARSRAAGLRAEWLETSDLIDEAKKLAEGGDLPQAAERAERARQQGELAAAQAEREAAAWQRRVVR
jgi:hypothetical protein